MRMVKKLVKQYLSDRCDRAYRKKLEERKGTYQASPVTGEAPFTNEVFPLVLLVTGKGCVDIQALRRLARAMERHRWQMAYGDEDVVCQKGEHQTSGLEYRAPWYKPDWSPDTWKSFFYTGSLMLVSRRLWEDDCRRETHEGKDCVQEGEVRLSETDGIPTYTFASKACMYANVRRLVVLAGGYQRACTTIGHEPIMVFHGRDEAEQGEYLDVCPDVCLGDGGEGNPASEVSLIIPSKDNPAILRKCLGALARQSLLPEILVVDNGSSEDNRREVLALLEEMEGLMGRPVTYIYEPMEFHFSRMCNLGASRAGGQILVFLNDDVELVEGDTIEKLAARASLPYTGAVGIKLYYPDSIRIQHVGITNLPMGPVHKLQFLEDNEDYYFGRNKKDYNVLAVTGACLAVKADRFWEAGAYPEHLPVAFNDVALCFGLWEKGWSNVVLNSSYAYHHESLSRGQDEAPDKLNRLLGERKRLYELYPDLEGIDPYYPGGLGGRGLDVRIRPAYLTSGNMPTEYEAERMDKRALEGYREDSCLLVRVEEADGREVLGYGVILGDDNATYQRWLLLEGEGGESYRIPAGFQYRPDLEENMEDQKNVALSGFHLRLPRLPEGSYRIGMVVSSRVSRLRLCQMTHRRIRIGQEEKWESKGTDEARLGKD